MCVRTAPRGVVYDVDTGRRTASLPLSAVVALGIMITRYIYLVYIYTAVARAHSLFVDGWVVGMKETTLDLFSGCYVCAPIKTLVGLFFPHPPHMPCLTNPSFFFPQTFFV